MVRRTQPGQSTIPRTAAEPRRRPGQGRWLLAALGAALAVLTGCADPENPPPVFSGDYTEFPLSNGARIVHPLDAVPPPDQPEPSTCGALSSLRPDPAITPGAVRSGGALADIVARGRLIVGVDPNANLFSFRDPTTGTLMGFGVDVAREVARDLFADASKIEFRLQSSADRLETLEHNQVDLVVPTTSVTCELAGRVAFSTVYLEAFQRLLVRPESGISGPADLARRRVCTHIDTPSLDVVRRSAPKATIVAVPNWADCLVALQQRQVDAASTDDVILAGLAVQDPNHEIIGPHLASAPYGVAVNKHNEDLLRFVNGTLERLRTDGTWMSLYNRWLAPLGLVAGPPAPSYRD